jgi:hypothetical protein
MRMFYALGVSALIGLSGVAHGQGYSGGCAPTGTVIKGRNSGGEYTTTYKGSDLKNAAVCIRVTTGPGAGASYGKELRSTLSFYPENYIAEGQEAKITAALWPLLSGKADQVNFDILVNRSGNYGLWTNNEDWKRAGEEQLTIDGRPVKAVKFERHEVGKGGSNWDAITELWYDPIRFIWLKGRTHFPGGPIRSGFEVTSISAP